MHSWLIHACVTTDALLCYSEEPAKQTDSKGVASAQFSCSGSVTKHFAPRLTDEEHKHAYA